MASKYGAPKPEFREGACWLEDFIASTGQTQDRIAHVLCVNHARVWEWRNQQEELPQAARDNLNRWRAAGFPRFEYWLDTSDDGGLFGEMLFSGLVR